MGQENTKYGTVEQKIHTIADLFPECEYHFADFAQANVAFDRIEKPTILFVLPASGRFDIHNDVVRESPSTQIWFMCPSDFDFDGEENDCRVEAMKRIGIRFVDALNKSDMFEYIEGFEYKVAYDAFDMNLTGVCFLIELVEKQGILLCQSYKRPEWDENV